MGQRTTRRGQLSAKITIASKIKASHKTTLSHREIDSPHAGRNRAEVIGCPMVRPIIKTQKGAKG